MDFTLTLQEIEGIAARRLAASGEDEEEWSFLFRTPGSEEHWYYRVDDIDWWEFEPDLADLPGLTWDKERIKVLSKCEDEPTETELHEWQIAKAKWDIKSSDVENARQAFVIPVIVEMFAFKVGATEGEIPVIVGYVNVECGPIEAGNDPEIEDVFRTREEAFEALKVDRVLDGR